MLNYAQYNGGGGSDVTDSVPRKFFKNEKRQSFCFLTFPLRASYSFSYVDTHTHTQTAKVSSALPRDWHLLNIHCGITAV